MSANLVVQWVDLGHEPQNPPTPAFPLGIDIDASDGAKQTCSTRLPYPAKRCGHFMVTCNLCLLRVVITTAGRVDDPRSVKLACQIEGTAQ